MTTAHDHALLTTAPRPGGSPAAAAPPGPLERALATLAVVTTLPYLVLKVAWLSGSRVGLAEGFGEGAGMLALNVATALLDVVALLLALALLTGRAARLPGALILPPLWIGAGLLGQILLALPVQLLASALIGTTSPSAPAQEVPPIADWVYALVYTGFAGLGIGLLGAFAVHAVRRWGHLRPPAPGPAARTALPIAGALAVVASIAHLTLADVPLGTRVLDQVIGGAAALALVALTGRTRSRVLVAAAFVLTGALAAWGTYLAVVTVVPNPLVGPGPVDWATAGSAALRALAGFVGAAALGLRLRGR